MKILFVSSGMLGAENYGSKGQRAARELQLFGISKELVRMGHEAFIIRRWYGLDEIETIDGVKIINVGTPYLRDKKFGQIASIMLFSLGAVRKIKKLKPDIVCLIDRYSGYFPSKLKIPKIFIASTHDAFGFVKEYEVNRRKLNYIFFDIKRKMEENIMRRSDSTISLTESIKDYLVQRGITNTYIMPNAIDPNDYYESREENFILFAGRLVEHKGIQYLIKAFYEMRDDITEDLVIIGSGPYKKTLKELVVSQNIEDKVKFVSFLPNSEYRELLSKCKVFVFPSLFEAFGVVVIEAMASSKPVITSNIIGPKDIITQGYDGFLFEKGNVDELKKYLELLLENKELRKKIGGSARTTVEERYAFEKVADSYLKLYEKILLDNVKKQVVTR
jgi:glycosyltransferase involved in cell wall biosynthesis